METTVAAPQTSSTEADFLPLQGTDYVEFWVGNAKQAAHYYKTAFGFQSLAYAGPETGVKDRASYAIRQNKLTLVLTTALRPDAPIADHVALHGDGVNVCRSLRGERRLEPDESVGEILRGCHGIPEHPLLRRQGHLDRILRAHEQGDEQRQRFCEVPDQ